MAYRLNYSDYSTTTGPPDPAAWVGPPGPMGPPGPPGPPGPMPPGGPFLPLTGGTVTGPLTIASMRAGGVTGTNTIWLGPWTETSTTGPYAGDFIIQKFYNVAGGPVGNVSSFVVQSIINNAPNIYVSPIMSQMFSNTSGPSAGVHAGISSAVYRQAGPQSLFAFWVRSSTAAVSCRGPLLVPNWTSRRTGRKFLQPATILASAAVCF